MKAFRRLFIVLAVLALAFVSRFYLYGPMSGWFNRSFRTPAVLHSTFIVDYERAQAATQRQKLFDIYQTKRGSFGLHRTFGSIEGTSFGAYLLVEEGCLTFINDFTRDNVDTHSTRGFTTRYPTNLVLAPVSASEESAPFTPPQGSIVLKLYLDHGVLYF